MRCRYVGTLFIKHLQQETFMAFDEYDDFEQEKLVKQWIKENWFTIALGLVIGLGSVIGLNYYKSYKQQQRYKIAAKYNEFSKVLELKEFDEAQKVLHVLETTSDTNFYTIQAHLLLAKEFAEKNELEKAASELNSIIKQKPDQLFTEFTKLRLARIYNAMGKYDDAIAQVDSVKIAQFISTAKEIAGDAYAAKGNKDQAKTAYTEAIAEGEGYSGKRSIEMKLGNS